HVSIAATNIGSAIAKALGEDHAGAIADAAIADLKRQLVRVNQEIENVGKARDEIRREDTGGAAPSPLDEVKEDIADAIKLALPRTEQSRFMQGVSGNADPSLIVARKQAQLAEDAKRQRDEQLAEARKMNQ